MKKYMLYTAWSLVLACACAVPAHADPEPEMTSYSCLPIFQVQSVFPNILIMLDNSGSMNFPAYPDPYNPDTQGISYGTTINASFKGGGCQVVVQIESGYDDAEERVRDQEIYACGYDWRGSADLDLSKDDYCSAYKKKKCRDDACSRYEEQVIGLRFRNINIPKTTAAGDPITITSARIAFTAYASSGKNDGAELYIAGEDSDDAAPFTTATGNISSRPETSAKVTWSDIGQWAINSQANAVTPDLKEIVQEIIDRPGWAMGNDMVFKITGKEGTERRAYSYNTSSSRAPMLVITYEPCETYKYYGYFDPEATYSYASGVFVRDETTGQWSGNFLNWLTMRRIDILRKALMGGKRPCESCNGKANLQGEVPAQSSRYWQVYYAGPGNPYPGGAWYGIKDGRIYVKTSGDDPWNSPDAYYVIEVEVLQQNEPQVFCDEGDEAGNPCGIIQKVGDQARWGNIWFEDSASEGGEISSPIGGGIRDIINDFQSTDMDTSTPLAETLLTAMKYFQQSCSLPSGYKFNCSNWGIAATTDPFFNKKELVECAKSFVLMLTDGVPTNDTNIPTTYRYYDGDNNESSRSYSDYGSDYLDDVALYAHTNDLRADLEGDQTMDLYVVYAFGKDPEAMMLLKEAAMNGGFVDKDGDKKPDGYNNDGCFDCRPGAERKEWDKDGDAIPDTFYDAQDGYQLESQLLKAINDILNRAASGTAVSVLATTGEGEGTLVQAIFRPGITAGLTEVNWVGYLQALWVDPKGNIREDTNRNGVLEVDIDKLIVYYFDSGSGETKVRRYPVSSSDPYPDPATTTPEEITLETLGSTAIWEAGSLLADRPAADRKIYTYVGDGAATASPMPFGTSPCVAFTADNKDAIMPFLGVQDNNGSNPVYAVQPYAYLGATKEVRAANLINFIRGNDVYGDGMGGSPLQQPVQVRSRWLDGKVWKLGDIVYSTPVTISGPVEQYGLIYDDLSYQAYKDKYKNGGTDPNESVVYVGGNDGMLHAFTAGYYDRAGGGFVRKAGTPERIGDELWAYIPRALLPHLKWLANPGYESLVHVPYVDLKPKIIDVRIFTPDDVHVGGWGTVLVGGMKFGGKHIWVNDESGSKVADYYSSFFAIDITDPRNPRLLWDRWFPNLGLTINQPTVIQVGRTYDAASRSWNSDDAWFLVMGSSYIDYVGWTGWINGSIYVVDIKTGELKRQFQTQEILAYMNTPIAIDKSLNYSVDSIYVAANYANTSNWTFPSSVYRIGIPITNDPYIEGFDSRYDKDPATWTWTKMIDDPNMFHISAPFTISSDKKDNVWLYVGSGKYETFSDKTTTYANWLLGVKDPFYNLRGKLEGDDTVGYPSCYHSYTASITECAVDHNDLFYANPYAIRPGDKVDALPATGVKLASGEMLPGGESSITTWDKLIEWVESKDSSTYLEKFQGWYRILDTDGTNPSGRMINKPTVLGGVALFPVYKPSSDICGLGGDSELYALYYETGTAYRLPVLTALDNSVEIQYKIDLGYGLTSSFGVHSAKESSGGSTVYSQMSTGLINEIDIVTPFSNKSGVEAWKEGR